MEGNQGKESGRGGERPGGGSERSGRGRKSLEEDVIKKIEEMSLDM